MKSLFYFLFLSIIVSIFAKCRTWDAVQVTQALVKITEIDTVWRINELNLAIHYKSVSRSGPEFVEYINNIEQNRLMVGQYINVLLPK